MRLDYRSLNPLTGELLRTFEAASDAALDDVLQRAHDGYRAWKETTAAHRAERLRGLAVLLRRDAPAHARLIALEMGKPLAQGEAEVRKCADACDYYAERGAAFLAPEPRKTAAGEAWVRFDPLGPILAIMPWNFPFWQVFRFAAPALTAGNVVIQKHAPGTPQCALAIEAQCREAGFPPGVFQNAFLTDDQAARAVADLRVRGVTLTGSAAAGRAVAQVAGRHLKPLVLELGGSDPFIVLDDADLERAARVALGARCQNSGQSCIASKRFLVQRAVLEPFLERFVPAMESQRVGDPLDPATDIGPLAREDLRDRLAGQVDRCLASGARALCGGSRPEGPGFFYPPTVLVDASPDSPTLREELFGPVATVAPFESDDDAVALANDTDYGLGASLWTTSRPRAESLVPRIEAGSVFVNGQVRSDAALPFGGIKASGFGRELGREGMMEFVNVKTVVMS